MSWISLDITQTVCKPSQAEGSAAGFVNFMWQNRESEPIFTVSQPHCSASLLTPECGSTWPTGHKNMSEPSVKIHITLKKLWYSSCNVRMYSTHLFKCCISWQCTEVPKVKSTQLCSKMFLFWDVAEMTRWFDWNKHHIPANKLPKY